jgi:hypothetical protein
VASVDNFLKDNKGLAQDDSALRSETEGIKLDVVISGISPQFVKFNHMGTDYTVDRNAVLDIEKREDPSGSGKAATITLNRDAALHATYSLSASDLTSRRPFSMARPSPVPFRPVRPSPREAAWRIATGYAPAPVPIVAGLGAGGYPTLEEIYPPLNQTLTACESETGGTLDDTITDDERADY